MRKILVIGAIASAALSFAAPAAADPASGLSFRELEYQAPRDPLLPSNAAIGDLHHTLAADLAPATDALNQAIPAGTSRANAEALLRKAGAKCRADGASTERCGYFDVATRDEYVDDVHWNVKLDLVDDKVASLAVDRLWSRH
ncbi:hypothetical protein [Sphingomonas oligoaromativorans]|uniref:hypothetical protein n=1 Tax=Sphingomonas oligoaromativorans TaxID=575322 RepID=UPI0014244D09|nr:hypothetical protein [Sphingomonas oligoaromativorans]NIJ33318.1 hypothetical protein [Sphingomonas oligoaromativorans]